MALYMPQRLDLLTDEGLVNTVQPGTTIFDFCNNLRCQQLHHESSLG